MSAATPGPWFVVDGPKNKMDAVCFDEGSAFPLAYVGTERTLQQKHANAKLIAAAPAMADALRGIVKRHDDQANEDNPIPEGESGRCTCGCIDCRDALAALRLAGVSQ